MENEMPDTNGFEELTASLGFSQKPAEEVPNTTADDGTAGTEENTSQESQTTEAGGEPAASTEPQEDKANHAFAHMRTQLGRYQKPIERAARAAGLSVDEFLGQLDNVAANKQAKDQGVSRDILDRIEKAEANNAAYDFEVTKYRTQAALVSLQTSMSLNNEDMQAFVKDCIANNIDLTVPGIDMVTLYKGRNHDKLLEKARNEWVIRDTNAQSRSTTPTQVQGRGGQKALAVDTPEAMRQMLASMPK